MKPSCSIKLGCLGWLTLGGCIVISPTRRCEYIIGHHEVFEHHMLLAILTITLWCVLRYPTLERDTITIKIHNLVLLWRTVYLKLGDLMFNFLNCMYIPPWGMSSYEQWATSGNIGVRTWNLEIVLGSHVSYRRGLIYHAKMDQVHGYGYLYGYSIHHSNSYAL